MANAIANIQLEGIGQDGHRFHVPVKSGTTIWDGVLVSQMLDGTGLVPASTVGAGPAFAKSTHKVVGDGTNRCVVESFRIYRLTNGATSNAFSDASLIGSPVYAFDDHTGYDNDNAGTLKQCGSFQGMEADGKIRVFVTASGIFAAGADAGESSAFSGNGVRGASTADVANLAAFTVAGVDGLTYVAGERILLKNQTTATQNGIYVVGTVSAGTAPLTRALDADGADEVIPGMLVHVSAGTVALDSWWALTANAPVVIGTTNLTFAQIPTHANLSATGGAALIGIQDTASAITGTNVETALAELAAIVSPGGVTKIQIVTGTFVAGLCTITVGAGQAVTAATKGFPCMSAIVTGSANVGAMAHMLANNVVGGSGVGQVLFRILDTAGGTDVDAAGLFAAILIN